MPQAETTAWVAAVVGDGGTVSAGRQTLVDNLIAGLKTDSVFTKLDRLWLFKAENSQSALRDLVAAAAATAVNSPAFTANQGYTGGSTKYISSNFNPTTAPSPKFTRNDASVFSWLLSPTTVVDAPTIGWLGGSFSTRIFHRTAADQWIASLNGGNDIIENSVTDATGLRTSSRTVSTDYDGYKNGVFFANAVAASVAVSNDTLVFMNDNGLYDFPGMLSIVGFGGGLSAQNNADLYSRLNTYMAGEVTAYAAFSTPSDAGRRVTKIIGY